MAQGSKPPFNFVVLELFGGEVVVPPVGIIGAGGNSLSITNHLKKPLTVYHDGYLDAPDPFTVPARDIGPPPTVTYPVSAQHDVPGTVFQLHIEASLVRALGAPGDPTIIIL